MGESSLILEAAIDVDHHLVAPADNLSTVPLPVRKLNLGPGVNSLLHRELDSRIVWNLLDPSATKTDDIPGPARHQLALVCHRPDLITFLDSLEYSAVGPGTDPFPLHMQRIVTVLPGGPKVTVRLAGNDYNSILNLEYRLLRL